MRESRCGKFRGLYSELVKLDGLTCRLELDLIFIRAELESRIDRAEFERLVEPELFLQPYGYPRVETNSGTIQANKQMDAESESSDWNFS